MIDAATEALLSLAEAAASLPRRRKGRKAHVATLYRWTTSGCRGIRLEYVQVGATRCTSKEALARFFDALTTASAHAPPLASRMARSPARRRRESERASRKLDKRGV